MLRPTVARLAALAFALAVSPHAGAQAPRDLVIVREGTLPIIITAPHGGLSPVPGAAARDQRPGRGERYVFTVDGETDRLALGIADEIEAITGKTPYVVVAKFDRKYIDANRPADVAMDDPAARPYYDHYHGAIRRFVDEVRSRYPAAILLDVHGQRKMNDSLVRGTANGRTVAKLTARAGFDAITGPRGLFGQLEAQGFRVFPANTLPTMGRHEDAGFNGGYTTTHYGSGRPDGIDAVQLEFGGRYRTKALVDVHAKKAARAIAAFYDAYLR